MGPFFANSKKGGVGCHSPPKIFRHMKPILAELHISAAGRSGCQSALLENPVVIRAGHDESAKPRWARAGDLSGSRLSVYIM
jgi:hypothetical protein